MTRKIGWFPTALMLICLGCDSSDAPHAGEHADDATPGYALDPGAVPEPFRHLVPLATEWGIGDDDERMERIERSSPTERSALAGALAPHQAQITAWLDSFGSGVLPDEAAAFLYLQLAVEEMR